MNELVQRIGGSRYISCFDARKSYHQILVKPSDRWLTAFVCDAGLFQWTRVPFGLRSAGCTFVRVLAQVLKPIRLFTHYYVDDMAVQSDSFDQQLSHLEQYLAVIKDSGLTLGLSIKSVLQGVKFPLLVKLFDLVKDGQILLKWLAFKRSKNRKRKNIIWGYVDCFILTHCGFCVFFVCA